MQLVPARAQRVCVRKADHHASHVALVWQFARLGLEYDRVADFVGNLQRVSIPFASLPGGTGKPAAASHCLP